MQDTSDTQIMAMNMAALRTRHGAIRQCLKEIAAAESDKYRQYFWMTVKWHLENTAF